MPKVSVDCGEWYPCYTVAAPSDFWELPELELSEEDLLFIRQAEGSWRRAQNILAKAYRRAPV